jgi:hypothetical protein
MTNVARPKKDSTKPAWKRGDPWPLRVATPEELAEDRRRYLEAKPRLFATVEAFERFAESTALPVADPAESGEP